MFNLSTLIALISGYKNYLIIAGVIAVLSAGLWYGGKWQGREEQKVTQAEAKAAATLQGVKAHDEINREVNKLSDPDLDADLDKWMRD